MGNRAGRFAPTLIARGLLSVVYCGFGLIALLGLGYRVDDVGSYLLAAGFLVVLLVLQLGYFARPLPAAARGIRRWRCRPC